MLRLLSTFPHTSVRMSPEGKGQPSQTVSQRYFEERRQNFLHRSEIQGSRIFTDDLHLLFRCSEEAVIQQATDTTSTAPDLLQD